VACDLPQDVDRDARVGHPGEACVSQVVAPQVAVAQGGDDLVPVGGVAQHGGGDPAAAGSGEQAGHRVVADLVQPPVYEGPDLGDDRDDARSLALRAFIDYAARSRGGLAADVPGPGLPVDVGPAHARCLADAGRCAGDELDDVGPSCVATVRARDERGAELLERVPVRKGEQARVVELVLGVLELALPALPSLPGRASSIYVLIRGPVRSDMTRLVVGASLRARAQFAVGGGEGRPPLPVGGADGLGELLGRSGSQRAD
jgi:hypothetical protein